MAARRTLIAGGRILDPDGELDRPPVADILIEDGRILAVEPPGTHKADSTTKVIDAHGLLVSPGFVNAHYHSHDVLLRGLFEQVPLDVWGLHSFPSGYPRRSPAEVRVRTALGAIENMLSGVTTLQDMVTIVGPDRQQADAMLDTYDALGLRAVVAIQVGDRATVDTAPFWREDLPADLLAQLPGAVNPAPMQDFIAGLLSASPSPLIRWGLAPSAPQRCSEALLRWMAEQADAHDLRVFTHVYETKSQAVLARLEYGEDRSSLIHFLDRVGLLGPRLTIAHGVWITDAEVERLGAAGAHLACNPVSNLKLLNGVAPIRAYADAGVTIALGCDNCSGNDAQNMFEAMKSFALFWGLQTAAGAVGAAREAFRAATLGGAAALGLSGEVGAIRPGHRADLVLLDLDDPAFVPLNSAVRQLVYAATPRAVRSVLVDGRPVVSDGRITGLDRAALTDEARRLHADLLREVDRVVDRMGPLARALLTIHRKVAAHPIAIDRLHLG